jgi:FG-GAP-like repeat
MRSRLLAFLLVAGLAAIAAAQAAEWRVERIDVPARVTGIETVNGKVRAYSGGLWYVLVRRDDQVAFSFSDLLTWPEVPNDALPGSKLAVGRHDIARAWLADPTDRYDHGILGDKIEAGSVVIETRDGVRHPVQLKNDAVFEDLEPRIADLNGDGRDNVIVVKSYIKRGSALAVIGERRGKYEIIAETPPLGAPYRWLDPVGLADFTGDHKTDIALVRQPHVDGMLELWSWRDGRLRKVAELPDATDHIAGSRAMDMSAVADFDGDGVADIAIPSFDRDTLRIVSFAPTPRTIASIKLPAKAVTNLGLLPAATGPAVVLGLADGSLVWVRRVP